MVVTVCAQCSECQREEIQKAWVNGGCNYDSLKASPTNHCWCQKTRVIAVLCGIKIFKVRCLVLSQYTHLTVGRTDGRTDGQTDRQNCDSNTVRCITCSRTVKTIEFSSLKFHVHRS